MNWKAIDYPVEIRTLAPCWGGGYVACIPMLGRYAFCGDGETPQEALDKLEEVFIIMKDFLAEKGETIPDPPAIDECDTEENRAEWLKSMNELRENSV